MRKKIILGMALLLLVSLRCFGIIDRPNESHYMPDDTTVYDVPDKPAQLLDAVAYFKKNNRYNDWDKNDRKRVTLQGVVEKDSTIT
ncbi:MAG: hypothetical protein LBQ39_04580, partial [Tannerellaceae bacterium]|nr:hypothetical protein [Tannerellaceae bacterium]